MKLVRSIANIVANTRSPAALREIFRKTWFRLFPEVPAVNLVKELTKLASDFPQWATKTDSAAYGAAQKYQKQYQAHLRSMKSGIEFTMGGAAHTVLLYFLVRAFKPSTIVETGVAAGHSSRALLCAQQANGNKAKLYSSDFPYLTEHKAEAFIGVVVEKPLRKNWVLLVEGDRTNLPVIRDAISGKIDLFHYDSDKTKSGREFALRCLGNKLLAGSIVVFDDIQDNGHFLVWSAQFKNRRVFEIGGKFVGLVFL